MFKKILGLMLVLLLTNQTAFAIADQLDNVETAYVFINSVIYNQTGGQVLDFRDKFELRDEYPNKIVTAINTGNPSGALGSNYSTYANIENGGELKVQLPVFPHDAQSLKVYYMYRVKKKVSGHLWWKKYKWVYYSKTETITPDKTGSTSHSIKLNSDQTVSMETIGREISFKNAGHHTNYSWWDIFNWFGKDEPTPMYLQVVKVHNLKVPLVFPKIAVDGNRNLYNVLKKFGPHTKKGSYFKRDYSLEVYKNRNQKLFEVLIGEELYKSTGDASYELVGEAIRPIVSLSVNPQGNRIYLHSDLPKSVIYKYNMQTRALESEDLGFKPVHMKVSTNNRSEEWIHYSIAQGLSIAETWGPENSAADCERFELWKNKIYKTSSMYDINNGQAEEGGYVNMATKDVYGDVLTFYNPGEGFAYSNTGANTSAHFALGNTTYSYTAMGRRAQMGVSMGVDVNKGEKLIIYERSNFKIDEYEFDAKQKDHRFTTKEGEDYRITIDGKVVSIVDVGSTPMKQIRKKVKDGWILWPILRKYKWITEWVEDPVLNNPENFGLTAFYNIATLKLTKVPYESIQYFAADGYGNKYTVRRAFGPYVNWKTTGSVVRNGQAVRYYKRQTFFTLFKLDINNNETELFTSPNIGWSYYYRTESPWPPGSCGCQGVMLSDYIPIYEAVAEADLATNNYSMPPRSVGVPIVDIKVTPTDAPNLQMIGVHGELFMDVSENVLVSATVAPSNDVKFENHDGIEWGHKFLERINTPEGKRGAPSGFINTHNPYIFVPNEYFYRFNIVDEVNRDIDGDMNAPDGAVEPSYPFDWAVTGGGFPSHVVLGRHMPMVTGGDITNPRLDSRYYVWAIRRLGIYNENKPEGENLVNAETPWTVVNHGARDFTDIEACRKILTDTGMDFVPDQAFLSRTATKEGYRFQPGNFRFDDGGIYEIMLAAGYRYIDWVEMRELSDAGDLRFWWDEPNYIKVAEPMKPDIETIIVRAFEPEDRQNMLEVVIDGDTNTAPDYINNKMMSNWQSFDDDGDGIPDHAVVEMNEDFDHKWTVKIVQKDRDGNITSDNQDILFVPNREQQQEIQDQIEPDEENKEQNLEIADKYSGVAFESSNGIKMHYEWKITSMFEEQEFVHNYYVGGDSTGIIKTGEFDIDIPYIKNNYQPWESRVQEKGLEDTILGQDGQRRSSTLNTNFNTPIIPLHYRITFTMWYTRIDYFNENGEFAYPLTDETGRVIGYDCHETIEKSEFYVDVYVKDNTLPKVTLREKEMNGGTTGDPFPREIIAYVSDNNPFDGMTELEYNQVIANLDKDNYIPLGSKAHIVYPKRLDVNRRPADVFNFEENWQTDEEKPENPEGWKWKRPSIEANDTYAYLTVTNALTAYDAPGIQRCSYEVRLIPNEEKLKMIMPYDVVSNENYGHFKYMVIAEDGMSNYYKTFRNNIPVNVGGSASATSFTYPGDANAEKQMKNVIHFNEDNAFINDNSTGVPKKIGEPGMLQNNESYIQRMELNTIHPDMYAANSYFSDDEGEDFVFKQAEGAPEDGFYGMQEGEIGIEDNDPPELYLRITNPKRNITIGYYIFDKNNADGDDGDLVLESYPFRDNTRYDEDIPGLLALSDENDRGKYLIAVGGGDHDIYLDPQTRELIEGYPIEVGDMDEALFPWYGKGYVAGGGFEGAIKDEASFKAMTYDFRDSNNLDVLQVEEDMRIKIELAAVDNVNNSFKTGTEASLNMSLGGVFENGMVGYMSPDVNSAVWITDDYTPNLDWSSVNSTENDKVIDYFIFRESTREDENNPDIFEYMYVRVRDNAGVVTNEFENECNEVIFRIPLRIINVQLLEMKIHELRREDKLGE
ncbi:MAG: hypothetical protein M0R46_10220 [Candidatus Muirbacterium halophilum]|nr:hypothetical protein [Candidatus Muirbacterium halophilum]